MGISYGTHPATFPAITTPTSAVNVSASSSLCVVNSDGSRTCTIPIVAPSGTDDFQVTAWDAVPVSGSFAGANRLSGTTVLNQTVTAGSTNSLSFTPATITGGTTPSLSLPLPALTSPLASAASVSLTFSGCGSGALTKADGSPVRVGDLGTTNTVASPSSIATDNKTCTYTLTVANSAATPATVSATGTLAVAPLPVLNPPTFAIAPGAITGGLTPTLSTTLPSPRKLLREYFRVPPKHSVGIRGYFSRK